MKIVLVVLRAHLRRNAEYDDENEDEETTSKAWMALWGR